MHRSLGMSGNDDPWPDLPATGRNEASFAAAAISGNLVGPQKNNDAQEPTFYVQDYQQLVLIILNESFLMKYKYRHDIMLPMAYGGVVGPFTCVMVRLVEETMGLNSKDWALE